MYAHAHILLEKRHGFLRVAPRGKSELMSPDGRAQGMMDELTKSEMDLHYPGYTEITPPCATIIGWPPRFCSEEDGSCFPASDVRKLGRVAGKYVKQSLQNTRCFFALAARVLILYGAV